MKLTIDLIQHSASFINTLKERELDLRGNKIPNIENLGSTYDQHDAIDLSDNDLKSLEFSVVLKRLKAYYLSNNKINKIEPSLAHCHPNLEFLILNNNSIEDFEALQGLSLCSNLKVLSLLENPIIRKPNYRAFVIYKIPSLKILDFNKISPEEKSAAFSFFDGKEPVFSGTHSYEHS